MRLGRLGVASIAAVAVAWAVACGAGSGGTGGDGGRGGEGTGGEAAAELRPIPPVRVGLERLAAGDADLALAGKRLGLVVHGASIALDGRHAIDLLAEAGLSVERLFAPEHGLSGRAAAGERIGDGVHPGSGLPVVSLYGEKRQPTSEDLAGLDALVFDLQGAGVRFYTYVSTLILCLEAAAEAGIDFVVLDRPNPLGGERIEGPVSAPRTEVPASFVNLAPGPLIHGLTMGEMARHVNAGLDSPARLSVVPMEGWRRDMTWHDTGRPWKQPSANLRFADAALVYPGVALLEATNVSEGRGTPAPFLLFGAPWLQTAAVGDTFAVPGLRLVPTRFTPLSSRAARRPKFLGEPCTGFEVRVEDPDLVSPYRFGVSILRALSAQPGFEWRRGGEALTTLLGTARVGNLLTAGATLEAILAADSRDHAAWREARAPALLY